MKQKKSKHLHTRRLCLGPITEQDRDALCALFQNREIAQTYMLPDFTSPEEAGKLFDRFLVLSAAEDRFVYGIYLEGLPIGWLNDVHTQGTELELGYVIDPQHKNQGYATEALAAAIRELFRMGYTAVRAGAFADNRASMRVMEKCGMARTYQDEDIPYRGQNQHCINYAIYQ
jgi:RimJ/RimL family protein N-acetyltransferase